MLVSLITPHLGEDDPISRRVREQARFFTARGHQAVVYVAPSVAETATLAGVPTRQTLEDEHFAASDLFVFHAEEPYRWLERLPKLERGAAVLYFHLAIVNSGTQPPAEGSGRSLAALAAFADLVVAESERAAALLANDYGYTAQPVHILPVNENTTAVEYDLYWAEAVAAATAWLPNRPYAFGPLPALAELHPPANRSAETAIATGVEAALGDSLLLTAAQQLVTSAATMQHDYVVRSRIPLIGPLLAWLRRNLTSHLREPYIDPTFQRQENFNRQVAKTIIEMVGRESASQASLEQRIAELEKQIQNVNRSPD